MQTPKDVEPRGYRDVTTSLTAASREDGPFLPGSFVAVIMPRNCDEDGISYPTGKYELVHQRRDVSKGTSMLHF